MKSLFAILPFFLGAPTLSAEKKHVVIVVGIHELENEMTDDFAWSWVNKWGGKTFTAAPAIPTFKVSKKK